MGSPIQELLHLPILRLYFSWKKPVKSTVLERRHKKTASATSTKSSLNMLASLQPSETPQLLPRRTLLPHLRQAIPTKCQLLCSMYRTNMVGIEPTSSPACPCLTANETVNHLTGACPLYKDKREAFIKSLSTCTQHQLHGQSIPPHLVADVTTNLILLGVNGDPPITAQALDHPAASTTVCLHGSDRDDVMPRSTMRACELCCSCSIVQKQPRKIGYRYDMLLDYYRVFSTQFTERT